MFSFIRFDQGKIAIIGCLLALASGCSPANQPVAKQPMKLAAAQAPSATKKTPRKPPAQRSRESTPPRRFDPPPSDDQPAKPRPAGSLADLVQKGEAQKNALPLFDDGKIAVAGIRKLNGKHLILYTDVPETVADVKNLPAVFDAAVLHWAKYFEIDAAKIADWKLVACVMQSKERFQGAGLYTNDLPDFPNGFQKGSQFWLYDQPSDYYRRHLLLHEGTHAFMSHWLGGAGPPWYSEGMAEMLGTHQWDGERLTLAYNPPDKTQVPFWGRVKIVRDEFAANRGMTLFDIFRYDAQAHLKNEAYGWCWAATSFLNSHPKTRELFQGLRNKSADRSIDFSKRFHEALKSDWPQIAEDWQLYVINLDYGYDVARAATIRKSAMPLKDSATVSVTADHYWQSTGVQLEAGRTYEITAAGRYSLAKEPQPWWCEPNGITIEYHQRLPLGILLAAVSDPQAGDVGITPLASPEAIGQAGKFTPKKTGTLYLCLNDSPAKLSDNEGSATVVIKSVAGGE